MTAIYRSTSRGQQVVCGGLDEIHVGEVVVDIGGPHFPKLVTAQVVALGQPFSEYGQVHVYGYLTAPTAQPAPAARPASTRRTPSRGRARAAAPYRGPVGNPSTPDCEDCLDVEDAGDARGCAAHRH